MRRVLSVWLPTFSTDMTTRRLTRCLTRCLARGDASAPPDARGPDAILLVTPVVSREIVAHACAASARAGVAPGMDLAHARSRFSPGTRLHVEHHRPERDSAALHALACWALRYSPIVAPDPPDGLLIDITGTERLHRGEGRLVRMIASSITRLGLGTRIAAAPTFGCAWAVARFGAHPLARVESGRETQALEALPIEALRVDASTCAGLAEIGITTIADLLRVPRTSLAARFDFSLLHRLHQALGETPESIAAVHPTPITRCEMPFDGVTDHWESIEAAAQSVLHDLVRELTKRERGVRRLDLDVLRPHAPSERVTINLSRASAAPRHLWSLLRTRLERVDLGPGVEGLILTATRTGRLRHEQQASRDLGAPEDTISPGAWGELIDTLSARLGADHVVHLDPVESHLPERAFRERSAMEAPTRSRAAVTPADRPTLLYPRPEPITAIALTPDGPLLSLDWRNRRRKVIACIGPERISQEWWRWHPPEGAGRAKGRRPAPPPDRDYFAAQVEGGRWLWVVRHAGTHRWFVQGEWA